MIIFTLDDLHEKHHMGSNNILNTLVKEQLYNEVYSYMNWSDLRQIQNVPDHIWKRYWNYLAQYPRFKESLNYYWSKCKCECTY